MTTKINRCDLCKKRCEKKELENGLALEDRKSPKIKYVHEMCDGCISKFNALIKELSKK